MSRLSSISIQALFTATAVGLVASAIYGFAFLFIVSWITGVRDPIALRAFMANSTTLEIGVIIFNVALYSATGYLAAAIAKRSEPMHGALSSIPYVIVGVYAFIANPAPEFWLHNAIMTALAPILGLLGGYLRRRLAQRTAINAKST